MATYWFVIAWFDNQSVQKSEVRQAAKDIVKSEIYLCIYYALIYFPKVIPRFCRGIHIFVMSYREFLSQIATYWFDNQKVQKSKV